MIDYSSFDGNYFIRVSLINIKKAGAFYSRSSVDRLWPYLADGLPLSALHTDKVIGKLRSILIFPDKPGLCAKWQRLVFCSFR